MYKKMDKSDIFTAELILIFSLVIDISRYFHCRVWITLTYSPGPKAKTGDLPYTALRQRFGFIFM